VGDGETADIQFGEERLHVAQNGARLWSNIGYARSRHCLCRRSMTARSEKVIADQAKPPLRVEALAIEAHDARRLPGRDAARRASQEP
jgi:hypothetical protein